MITEAVARHAGSGVGRSAQQSDLRINQTFASIDKAIAQQYVSNGLRRATEFHPTHGVKKSASIYRHRRFRLSLRSCSHLRDAKFAKYEANID